MKILTETNVEFDMSSLTQSITSKSVIEYSGDPLYYTVLDWTKQKLPDYMCRDMAKNKIDQYVDSAVRMLIGNVEVVLPYKWHILVASMDEVQYVSLEDIVGREFHAFAVNPWKGFMPQMYPIRIFDIITRYEFLHPKLGKQEMLAIPVGTERDVENNPRPYPTCIFAGEKTCRVPTMIDMSKLWG